jgi:lactate racemase
MTTEELQELLASADDELLVGAGLDPTHRRVLVIIPDGTRTAPIPLFFCLLYEQFGRRAGFCQN